MFDVCLVFEVISRVLNFSLVAVRKKSKKKQTNKLGIKFTSAGIFLGGLIRDS